MGEAGHTRNAAGLNNLQHCWQEDARMHKLEGRLTSPCSSCCLSDGQASHPSSALQSSNEVSRKDIIHRQMNRWCCQRPVCHPPLLCAGTAAKSVVPVRVQ